MSRCDKLMELHVKWNTTRYYLEIIILVNVFAHLTILDCSVNEVCWMNRRKYIDNTESTLANENV